MEHPDREAYTAYSLLAQFTVVCSPAQGHAPMYAIPLLGRPSFVASSFLPSRATLPRGFRDDIAQASS